MKLKTVDKLLAELELVKTGQFGPQQYKDMRGELEAERAILRARAVRTYENFERAKIADPKKKAGEK
jgi:hypothetical protein